MSVSCSTKLQYAPLSDNKSCIRVLIVHAARSQDEQIICDLQEINYQKQPLSYWALSYSWAMPDGDASFSRSITIQGHSVAVTQNLFECLTQLRKSDEDLKIWVDAVCINQQDVEERNAQVSQMARIYLRAGLTVSWLGQDSEQTSELLDWLENIHDDVEPLAFGQLLSGPPPSFTERADSLLHPYTSSERSNILQALGDLVNTRYFGRRWVVQEVLSSSQLVFRSGSATFTRQQLAVAYDLLLGLEPHLAYQRRNDSHYVAVQVFELLLAGDKSDFGDLPEILQHCNNMQCVDDRDRLFALASLDKGEWITPDYGRTTADVYTAFATQLVARGTLQALFGNLIPSRLVATPSLALPSWVPDLRQHFDVRDGDQESYSGLMASVHGTILSYQPYIYGVIVNGPRKGVVYMKLLANDTHSSFEEAGIVTMQLMGTAKDTIIEPGSTICSVHASIQGGLGQQELHVLTHVGPESDGYRFVCIRHIRLGPESSKFEATVQADRDVNVAFSNFQGSIKSSGRRTIRLI